MRMCPSSEVIRKQPQAMGPDGVEVPDHPMAREWPRPVLGLGGGRGADQDGQECEGQATHPGSIALG